MQCTRRVSGTTLIMYAQDQKNGKPNNLNFGNSKTKGPKQDSKNWLRSPIDIYDQTKRTC